MSVSPRFLAPNAFTFAFPHASRWEDRGQEDRLFLQASMVSTYGGLTCRIPGYRFLLRNDAYNQDSCWSTLCWQDHESDKKICLVFNNLVMTPNEEVIPADQSRLHVLLSHELTIGTLHYFVSEANLKPYFLYIAHMLGVELCWPFGLYQSTTQNR